MKDETVKEANVHHNKLMDFIRNKLMDFIRDNIDMVVSLSQYDKQRFNYNCDCLIPKHPIPLMEKHGKTKQVSKRVKGRIRIPFKYDVDSFLAGYDCGWGKNMACIIGFLRKHKIEVDEEALIKHSLSKLKDKKIHRCGEPVENEV